ncbi:MAG: guanine deaminase [Ponticaulis sp.]|nr:guanine deaminase [Ponticaulis sp.]
MTDQVLRGRVLTFFDHPTSLADTDSFGYWEDGAIAVLGGKIDWRGHFSELPERYNALPVTDHRPRLILPGLIDTHAHFAQMGVIGSYGAQLLDWLEQYTFVQETRFDCDDHSGLIASSYFDELILNGVTTSVVYGTSHKNSMDAFFAEADQRQLCMIAGKTLMDRNAPDDLRDTAQSGYDDSKALIERWHGKGRLKYAVTPRFAISCSEAQLELAGTLLKETPDAYLQTHLSENQIEIETTAALFPAARDYLDVYEHYGFLGEKSLFGHCIHLTERERAAMKDSRSVAVFCPTSNLFLGSGLFDYAGMSDEGIRISLASDVGAGTSYSMLTTASEAYKVCQLNHYGLNPLESFYLMTLGNARALSLDHDIGTIEAGTSADLIVLNSIATSAMNIRMEAADSLTDELFILQTLGDDRAISATYVAGNRFK